MNRIAWNAEATILSIWVLLCTIGLVVATSASMEVAAKVMESTATVQSSIWHYSMGHAFYLGIAALSVTVIWRTPLSFWYQWHKSLFLLGFFFLALIAAALAPGMSEGVNDHWQQMTALLFSIPLAELFTFVFVVYLAAFLARIQQQISTGTTGLIRILVMTALSAGLIFAQSDFGTAALVVLIALLMLLVAGWPMKHWLVCVVIALGVGWLAITEQFDQMYSLPPVAAFSADQYGGPQLAQALAALGRGDWFGLGLGQSIQKMMHFEPRTDFVFAILGEELGLIGTLAVLGLFVLFVLVGLCLAWCCLSVESFFAAFLVIGAIGLVGMQALINIGINTGMLPANGLTLPFMSDGISLIVYSALVGLVLRAAHEFSNKVATDVD